MNNISINLDILLYCLARNKILECFRVECHNSYDFGSWTQTAHSKTSYLTKRRFCLEHTLFCTTFSVLGLTVFAWRHLRRIVIFESCIILALNPLLQFSLVTYTKYFAIFLILLRGLFFRPLLDAMTSRVWIEQLLTEIGFGEFVFLGTFFSYIKSSFFCNYSQV